MKRSDAGSLHAGSPSSRGGLRRRFGVAGFVVVGAVGLAACNSDSESSGDAVSMRLFFAPATLDPQAGDDLGSGALAAYAYDTPVALRDGKIVPQLATKWKVTPVSAKLWIKPGVTCSHGSKLTAAEVARSIERMKEIKAPSTVPAFGSLTGFTATADNQANTVTVELDKPYGDLLLGLTRVRVLCRAALDDPSVLKRKTFGSGPYSLSKQISGSQYTYVLRKGYSWGPGGASTKGQPETLVFKVLPDENTATNSFLTGGLDVTMAQGRDRARLDRNARATVKEYAVTDNYAAHLNHASGRPTADVNVRRALFAGLDRADLAKAILGPDGKVPQTVVRADGICYQPQVVGSAMPAFDVKAAQQHAAEAGYDLVDGKLTKDGKQLKVRVIIPDVFSPRISDYLISAWGDVGIEVDAQVQPTPQAVQTVSTPGSEWDVFLAGFVGLSPSQLLSFSEPPPPAGPNTDGVDNAEFNRIASAARTKLTEEACDLWAQAERALYEQADIIPWGAVTAAWYGNDVELAPWTLATVHPESLRRTN